MTTELDAGLNARIRDIPRPKYMLQLAISDEGFPVPWFVQWVDEHGNPCPDREGKPDFRIANYGKLMPCVQQRRCWICGGLMGTYMAFTIGPMCAVNRAISEPPSHRDCAIYSVQACPFLSQPRMRRNEKDLPETRVEAPGFPIKRNPGVICIWVSRTYRLQRTTAGNEGLIFMLDDPTDVLWFAEGQPATRQQVLDSIESGLPTLMEMALEEGPEAVEALNKQVERAKILLPT